MSACERAVPQALARMAEVDLGCINNPVGDWTVFGTLMPIGFCASVL